MSVSKHPHGIDEQATWPVLTRHPS